MRDLFSLFFFSSFSRPIFRFLTYLCGLQVNLPIIDIINVPGLGDRVAETLVNQLGIKSQNDRALLDKAKETAYQKGFYEGTMIIGEYKGTKVEQAKALIREKLVKEGVALAYCEPTSQVISRSGEECVVALIDQWYIDYGEEEWRKLAERCLSLLDTYSEETRNQFKGALDWMKQWACSRSYGLGTKLPWDESYLIDSLSDSTIYMAYYSIAHILHNGSLDGANGNPQIPASEMTPEVFDHIFLGKEAPKTTNIPVELLQKMKQEFEYWYPVDLRVSGKDLIPNHLTFFIYNHTALFGESKWPKGIRANGHILLNNQKMSKSTGNFITLGEAVERYSADGMRFALADAGDSLEDANFTDDTANSAILRLYTQIQWIKETTESKDLREGEPSTFFDKVFLNQMRECVDRADSAYSRTNYKEAVKAAFYDIQTARDEYRVACTSAGIQPNKQLFTTFCEVQTVILAPICPHACEHIWGKILGKAGTVTSAQWPSIGSADTIVLRQKHYVDYMISTIRTKIMQVLKKKGAVKPTTCTLFVAKKYPAWQEAAIKLVEKFYIEAGKQMPPKAKIADAAKTEPAFQSNGKLDGAIHKKAMAFLAQIEADVVERGADAFALEVPFSEIEVLNDNLASFKKQLNLENIVIYSTDDEAVAADTKKDNAVPGKPAVHLQ
jgi:leucyl-tRNA synthetase